MSEVEHLAFEADGEIYEVETSTVVHDVQPEPTPIEDDNPFDEERGLQTDAIAKMQQARQMIRAYTAYALGAFKDFGAAEIEEVTLKFGLKLGGKAGIPYITEGTAESNLEIEVKCKLPTTSKTNPGS
ncbi:MAG TPA: CU044_2847 family protein [Allocoleopsis sp.]